MFNSSAHPHTRLNILTGDWVLVSPHRMKRPWQGKVETLPNTTLAEYEATCNLCPTNKRSDGSINPAYTMPYVFTNDFSALLPDTPIGGENIQDLLVSKSETGICRVICFSPNHRLTLPLMQVNEIEQVIQLWKTEFISLSSNKQIKYIQIFENKGEMMGCSNPHPHGQIWASSSIPVELAKETIQQEKYFQEHHQTLLSAYVQIELEKQERIVLENEHFVVLVPYWAIWPYETMIISKRPIQQITQFTTEEDHAFATILKALTTKYDNLFKVSFPYSAGMHQMPVNDEDYKGWHWHMHFYPPLLRSATVKKFMVGYEMLATPQRDLTPELVANTLKLLPIEHYTMNY